MCLITRQSQVPPFVLKHVNSLDLRPSQPAAVRECDSRCDPRRLLQSRLSLYSVRITHRSAKPPPRPRLPLAKLGIRTRFSRDRHLPGPAVRCAIAFRCLASVQHSSTQLNAARRSCLVVHSPLHPADLKNLRDFRFLRETTAIPRLQRIPANSARPELSVRHFRHPLHSRGSLTSAIGQDRDLAFSPSDSSQTRAGLAQSTKPTPKGRQKSPKAWTSGPPPIAQPPNVSGDRPSGPPTTSLPKTHQGHAPAQRDRLHPPSTARPPLAPLSAWADRSASWPLHVTPSPRHNSH